MGKKGGISLSIGFNAALLEEYVAAQVTGHRCDVINLIVTADCFITSKYDRKHEGQPLKVDSVAKLN
jgi:hypothetical protein